MELDYVRHKNAFNECLLKSDDDTEERMVFATKQIDEIEDEIYYTKEEKIKKLTKEMESLFCKVKQKAIKTFEQSQTSNVSEEIIKRVLSDKRNPTPCPDCGKYMEGPRGLKLHMSRTQFKRNLLISFGVLRQIS
ncbi:hypothetical protein BpHYR1_022765 [Brachionus plicatilis]|uniref:Uncharacterized protein n=1 Tax=Brachionus plicatilis TaxID=10195 RepID=A0A3M7Q8U5_BRAPC|nr:hypothetical protein BpHYR1_022765 [Brachionus plicatilis]